jgi:Flp pilus assembly protein TadG
MDTKVSGDCLFRTLRELCAANAANVTVTFALFTIPIFGAVGAAVDYSHANSVKAAMQAAADSTALMLAKEISGNTPSAAQISQHGIAYFTAMLNRGEVTGIDVQSSYTATGGSRVVVSAKGSIKTDFTGLIGFKTLSVGVTAQSAWGGGSKMQVALALDNTGSMAEWNKMGALKNATHSLLDQLKAAATNPNDVNVAIVPFSRDVNVGSSNYKANWIDWSDWDDNNGSDVSTQSCTTSAKGKNGKPSKKCSTTTSWVPDNHNTWNGCVTDRDQSYDTTNTAPNAGDKNLPATSASTLFPAEQYDACPVAMLGLSNDWSALNAKVDQMTPNGNTNQAIGLAWAWQALSNGQPMNAPVKGPDVQQIIILLTDGLNTQDRWYTDQASIDARQKILCSNIKAPNITLYTIQVNVGSMDPISTLLQQCASKPEYFFHLTSTGEVASVFNKIGTNLSKLRLAF